MSDGDRHVLRRAFDAAADRYDRARPGYLPDVLDDLVEISGLPIGSRLLEIGPGTGQATAALAERGYEIVAVELGAALAAVASKRLAGYANVRVVVAPFEEWSPPSKPFDAVVAATAFHWLDPEVRVTRVAQMLRTGGTLAIIETRRRPLVGEAVFDALRECHERWTTQPLPPFRQDRPEEPPDALSEVATSGRFEGITWRRYAADHEYPTAAYIDLFQTYSHVLALGPQRRAGLVHCTRQLIDRQLGGRMPERLITRLLVATKR